jgi:hypothetical protein
MVSTLERAPVSERETDIEFDFFEEPDTRERERPEPRRGGPRRPSRPPLKATPLLRLVGLVAFAIAVVVLLVVGINSCRGDGEDKYEGYMDNIGQLAAGSQTIGRDFGEVLVNPQIKQAQVETQLRGLATRQDQEIERARDLDPPASLQPYHEEAIQAFALRRSGLEGLADIFGQTSQVSRPGELLATQARRLIASDVVWDDLFKDPAAAELERREITGVAVPESNFLEDPNSVSPTSLARTYQRIRGTTTDAPVTGLHGNGVAAVKELPSGDTLVEDDLNTVQSSTNLAFSADIENSGDFQEVGVKVTLTIKKSPTPIVKVATIDRINPGQTQTVTFRNIGTVPFGQRTALSVEVDPVRGEENTANNTVEYDVIFTV